MGGAVGLATLGSFAASCSGTSGGGVANAGAVASGTPATAPASAVPPKYQSVVDRIMELRRIGLSARQLADAVTVTPSCGMAGASPQWASRAQRLCMDTARALADVD